MWAFQICAMVYNRVCRTTEKSLWGLGIVDWCFCPSDGYVMLQYVLLNHSKIVLYLLIDDSSLAKWCIMVQISTCARIYAMQTKANKMLFEASCLLDGMPLNMLDEQCRETTQPQELTTRLTRRKSHHDHRFIAPSYQLTWICFKPYEELRLFEIQPSRSLRSSVSWWIHFSWVPPIRAIGLTLPPMGAKLKMKKGKVNLDDSTLLLPLRGRIIFNYYIIN